MAVCAEGASRGVAARMDGLRSPHAKCCHRGALGTTWSWGRRTTAAPEVGIVDRIVDTKRPGPSSSMGFALI